MKRLLLPSLCALFSLVTLTSCQKEEESSLDLAKMLVSELQTVVDTESADAAAPRIAVINQRFQDAGVQVFALNGTALLRSSERPAEYNDALTALAVEIGRIRASKPVSSYDGEIDRDRLIQAVGQANSGSEMSKTQRTDAGTAFYKDSIDQSHGSSGEFSPCYGSAALAEALDYVADPSEVNMFTFSDDVVPIPDAVEVADGDDDDDAVGSDDDDASLGDDDDAVIDDDDETVTDDDGDISMGDDEISMGDDDSDDSDDEEVIDDIDDSDDSDDDSSDDSEDLDIDFGDFGI